MPVLYTRVTRTVNSDTRSKLREPLASRLNPLRSKSAKRPRCCSRVSPSNLTQLRLYQVQASPLLLLTLGIPYQAIKLVRDVRCPLCMSSLNSASDRYVVGERIGRQYPGLQLSFADVHLIEVLNQARSVGGGGFCDLCHGRFLPTGLDLAMKRPRSMTQALSAAQEAERVRHYTCTARQSEVFD